MRAAAILLAALILLAPGIAVSRPMHGVIAGSTSPPCANNAAFPEEHCTDAPPDGVDFFPSLFTTNGTQYAYTPGVARQSGQTYAALPPYDVAGQAFGVGYSPSQVAAAGGFKDPQSLGGTMGCSWNTGSGRNGTPGPWLQCSGNGGALDLENLDLSLHGCTYVEINPGSGYTSIKIKNNKAVNGPSCNQTKAWGTGYWGYGFMGYMTAVSSQGYLCAGAAVTGSEGIIVGDKITSLGGVGIVVTITGASADGVCAAGFTEYKVTSNQVGGTSSAPVVIGEATQRLTITITRGTLAAGQQIQGADGSGSAKVSIPAGTYGGPATYTIDGVGSATDATYTPVEPYIFGNTVAALINVTNGNAAPIDFEQNHLDGTVGTVVGSYGDTGSALAMDAADLQTSTSLTYAHNGILRFNGRPTSSQAPVLHVWGNYVEAFGFNPATGHMEWIVNGPPLNTYQDIWYYNNTVVATSNMQTHFGTANIWATGWSGGTVQSAILKYNTLIMNRGNPANDQTARFGVPGSGDGSGAIMQGGWEVQDGIYVSFLAQQNYLDQEATGRPCFYDPQSIASNSWLVGNVNMVTGTIVSSWGQSCAP